MRMTIPIPIPMLLAFLAMSPGAMAAPTCQDRDGLTARCGTEGAMPVGWTPSPQARWEREISPPPDQNLKELVKVIGGLALFFAMIALMPDFDGRRASDWDRQDSDDGGPDGVSGAARGDRARPP